MISTALDKKCVAEYEVVGDPALIPGLKQADRASRQTAGTATETGS
jgi:hypothetical protein